MGTVYLGTSPGGRPVAVKVARPELADDPEFRERFRREVEMARRVGGFWTAAVVDAEPDAAEPWLATEYVAGPTLAQAVVEHGPLPEAAVRRLAAGLTEALAAIHHVGLVHRDIKPSNVLLGADGPRLIDFGISQALERVKLTATGVFLGTPGFLSPEQITGDHVGPASDVFALGAVLVYAATGCGPFGDGQTSALMYRAMYGEPKLDGVPAELRESIIACLDRDPGQRPTPVVLLREFGIAEASSPAPPDWLPAPVQTLVSRYHTELHERMTAQDGPAPNGPAQDGPAQSSPAQGGGSTHNSSPSSGPVPVDAPPGMTASPPSTRVYTAMTAAPVPPPPNGPMAGGVTAGGVTAGGGGVRFGNSPSAAFLWGLLSMTGALVAAAVAAEESGARPMVRAAALATFIMLVVTGSAQLLRSLRPRLTLEVNAYGLTVVKGRDQWQVPWTAVARTRLVDDSSRPWLVIWLAAGATPVTTFRVLPFRSYHGGLRLFPVAHERWRRRRSREVRELRAALAWHGPHCYDRSP